MESIQISDREALLNNIRETKQLVQTLVNNHNEYSHYYQKPLDLNGGNSYCYIG